jgi:hypothetical protein
MYQIRRTVATPCFKKYQKATAPASSPIVDFPSSLHLKVSTQHKLDSRTRAARRCGGVAAEGLIAVPLAGYARD